MKHWLTFLGLAALGCCQVATAQNLLSNVSLSESATATALSTDYRLTRHSISTGGRGSRPHIYYTWDPYTDQTITSSVPLQFGIPSSATAAGTFYSPTYSATAKSETNLINSPTKAVLSEHFTALTTVLTTLDAHQAVTVTANPGGTITFTLTGYTNVSVTTTGDAEGVLRFFASGVGVLIGPIYGAGTVTYDGSLAPGTYWITTSLDYSSGKDMQSGTFTHPGTSNRTYGFTVTFTPGSADTVAGD